MIFTNLASATGSVTGNWYSDLASQRQHCFVRAEDIADEITKPESPGPVCDNSDQQRSERFASPGLVHRDREFAVEPIGRHRIARFTDHYAITVDDILRDQSRMGVTIGVRHAIEFVLGYLIQGTQKPIAPRSGREATYIGLDHAGIVRAGWPNCHFFSAQQMHCLTQVGRVTQSIKLIGQSIDRQLDVSTDRLGLSHGILWSIAITGIAVHMGRGCRKSGRKTLPTA